MRPLAIAGIAAAIALAAMVAWSLRAERGPVPETAAARIDTASGGGTDGAAAADSAHAPHTPEATEYFARQRFERRARGFLERAPAMRAVERSEEARALERELDERERRGEVSAGEAMLLRAALVEATAASDAERAERTAALIEFYREDAARREAAWMRTLANDARFGDYKARERAVVAEVMAMREIPGGIGRDEYLRRRLQQERETAYSAKR
ncbi:MAG: hypothetical protein KIS72_02050 [Luteimonas sp.]|nr:hypothetical protein [Luteimonas sp.]